MYRTGEWDEPIYVDATPAPGPDNPHIRAAAAQFAAAIGNYRRSANEALESLEQQVRQLAAAFLDERDDLEGAVSTIAAMMNGECVQA